MSEGVRDNVGKSGISGSSVNEMDNLALGGLSERVRKLWSGIVVRVVFYLYVLWRLCLTPFTSKVVKILLLNFRISSPVHRTSVRKSLEPVTQVTIWRGIPLGPSSLSYRNRPLCPTHIPQSTEWRLNDPLHFRLTLSGTLYDSCHVDTPTPGSFAFPTPTVSDPPSLGPTPLHRHGRTVYPSGPTTHQTSTTTVLLVSLTSFLSPQVKPYTTEPPHDTEGRLPNIDRLSL